MHAGMHLVDERELQQMIAFDCSFYGQWKTWSIAKGEWKRTRPAKVRIEESEEKEETLDDTTIRDGRLAWRKESTQTLKNC